MSELNESDTCSEDLQLFLIVQLLILEFCLSLEQLCFKIPFLEFGDRALPKTTLFQFEVAWLILN